MSIVFNYPWNGSARTIQLRDPELNDKYLTSINIKYKTAMDGSIRSRRGEHTNKFALRFVNLTRRKAIELRDFIILSQGAKIRYNDFNGLSWVGYIVTDPSDIVTDGRGLGASEPRQESNTINLEFEGTQI